MNPVEFLRGLFRFNRTNWRALFLCFAAASVFWIFNALNQEHSATVKLPLIVVYDKAQFVPTAKLPEHIEAHVSGSGWDILLKNLGFRSQPVEIIPEYIPGKNHLQLSASSAQIIPLLEDLKLNYFPLDTLTLSFDRIKEKRFYIRPNLSEVSFRSGFVLSEIPTLDPSEVLITGPSVEVDALPDTLEIRPQAYNLDEDWENRVLVLNTDGLKSKPERVKAVVRVEKSSNVKVKLPINFKKSKNFRLDNDSAWVVMQVPVSKSEGLPEPGWFVDAVAPGNPSVGYAEVRLIGMPAWAKVLKVDTLYLRKK